jgi:tetratricopeptide (TPR) repeat protein
MVLLAVGTLCAQQQPERFAQWQDAVKAHQPGNPGTPAVGVATWSGVELEEVVEDVKRYARSFEPSRRVEANDLLLRGAALHADIARLIPEDIVRRSAKQQRIFVVQDGREHGTRYLSIHWELGRSLLDAVAPRPAAHKGVLAWYQETSSDLLRLRSLAEAAVHLPKARQIFPADPVLLFISGVLHERFSSPVLQAAAASVLAGHRGEVSLSSAKGELGRAERFFRETLAIQPRHLEARVRYGHVLAALGRHAQAADELRAAIREGVDGEFLYFAELFLGSQEEVLGNTTAARAHFERAVSLYPQAQSPRLALSQLSRRVGDRLGAQRELRFLAELPDDERRRRDPWWYYYDAR